MNTVSIPEDNTSLWPMHGPAQPISDVSDTPHAARQQKPELEVSSLLEMRMKDWGENEDVAMEQLEWFQEKATALVTVPVAGGNDSMMTALFDLFRDLLDPPISASTKYLVKFYLWRCEMPLADTLLNFETPANWWRDLGVSKQMCFKMANEFCDRMNLPRRSNQRDARARKKMSLKRLAPKDKK